MVRASPTYSVLYYVHATLTTAFSNYLGALADVVKLQSIAAPEDKLFFSVVGWQALRLTLPQDRRLSEARTTMMAPILVKRPSFFHRDEVTHVVRYPSGSLVMDLAGLQ